MDLRLPLVAVLVMQIVAMPVIAHGQPAGSTDQTKPASGLISIRARPNSAEVCIDGELRFRDDSGIVLESVPAGSTLVQIRQRGYHTWENRVFVPPGERTELDIELAMRGTRSTRAAVIVVVLVGVVALALAVAMMSVEYDFTSD